MSVASILSQSCTVQELTTAQSDMGGMTKSFTTRISSLPCMLRNKSVSEVDEFGKRTQRNVFMLYVEYTTANTAIAVTDRVILDSRTFEVKKPYDAAGKGVLLQIELEEIK